MKAPRPIATPLRRLAPGTLRECKLAAVAAQGALTPFERAELNKLRKAHAQRHPASYKKT